MAVILVPIHGEDVQINWWNWRPTVALLVRYRILPDGERADRCLANGCGGYLSEQEAKDAAEAIASLIVTIEPGQSILHDGSVNKRPTDYSRPISDWDEDEWRLAYSAQYDWLKRFETFCRTSGGFEVL
jgi:hypothetical protein